MTRARLGACQGRGENGCNLAEQVKNFVGEMPAASLRLRARATDGLRVLGGLGHFRPRVLRQWSPRSRPTIVRFGDRPSDIRETTAFCAITRLRCLVLHREAHFGRPKRNSFPSPHPPNPTSAASSSWLSGRRPSQ